MIEAATFAEIDRTFPGRDLTINGAQTGMLHTMFKEGKCPWCGENFGYYPSSHLYKQKLKKRRLYFCKPSCLNAWNDAHKTALDKHIEDLKARIEYLDAQSKLPPEERADDAKTDLYRKMEQADARLTTALLRKCTKEGLL